MKIPIEISARHIHLKKEDLQALFGSGYKLQKKAELTQPGNFAAQETLTIVCGDKKIEKVRIVGPLRNYSQVELSMTDAFLLEMEKIPPIRRSGHLHQTPGLILEGPQGKVKLNQGVIIPWRHIHMPPKQAQKAQLKDGDTVRIKVAGKRGVIFDNVLIRTRQDYTLCMHLDTDEGNACGIIKKGEGKLII